MLSGMVRKLGEASKDKDGLVEVAATAAVAAAAAAAGLRAVKSEDECLFSSLLDEERDSFDVQPLH